MSTLIDQLKLQGKDVSWYYKAKKKQQPKEAKKWEKSSSCGFLSPYLLEGDHAYTVDAEGEKYKPYKKLKQHQAKALYYCDCCQQKFVTWAQAQRHIKK